MEYTEQEIVEKELDRLIEVKGEVDICKLNKLKGFDRYIANKLIKAGYSNAVAGNFDKFEGLNNRIEIINKLLEKKMNII